MAKTEQPATDLNEVVGNEPGHDMTVREAKACIERMVQAVQNKDWGGFFSAQSDMVALVAELFSRPVPDGMTAAIPLSSEAKVEWREACEKWEACHLACNDPTTFEHPPVVASGAAPALAAPRLAPEAPSKLSPDQWKRIINGATLFVQILSKFFI